MPAFIYEIASWRSDPGRAQRWITTNLLPVIPASQSVEIELYRPVPSRYGDAGPGFMMTLGFDDISSAQHVLGDPEFRNILAEGRHRFQLKGAFLRFHALPIDDEAPSALSAPFSFVVRYHLPAEDPEEFRSYYMKMHPPILAEFEGIRNIFCHTPEDPGVDAPLPVSRYLIGNEVVFDDVKAFERALDSPVLQKSKADSATFPPYCGLEPHFAMERTRLRER